MLAAPALGAALVTALLSGPVASPVPDLAAPRIIMVHGDRLEHPGYMVDWNENLQFMLATDSLGPDAASRSGMETVCQVALFWGNDKWDAIARDSSRWHELEVEQPEVGRGKIYRKRDTGAIYLWYSSAIRGASRLRLVNDDGRRILIKYGVSLD